MTCCRYDLLVNGGGAVILVYQRPSFVTQHKNVMVASNKFVMVETVTLLTSQQRHDGDAAGPSAVSCSDTAHHYYTVTIISPVVMATSQRCSSTLSSSCHSLSTVAVQSQVPYQLLVILVNSRVLRVITVPISY